MIIVEGPDGAGKTTLIARLRKDMPELELGPRASRSKEGPVENIADWAIDDVASWADRPLAIYDRHPLISDTIYAPLLRGGMDPGMLTLLTSSSNTYRNFLLDSLVIFCLPFDRRRVVQNVENDPDSQMAGVADHAGDLWDAYRLKISEFITYARVNPKIRWPVVYDYTLAGGHSYLNTYMQILNHAKERS